MSKALKVLITGATGFIGSQLVKQLERSDHLEVGAATRRPAETGGQSHVVGDITPETDWTEALSNVDVVIHCAARAHVLNDSEANPLELYRYTNTKGTLNLARQAAKHGISRFIFLSSIGVNGTSTTQPFTPDSEPCPSEAYAQSKLEAEEELRKIQEETSMEMVIIRPTLVYGPNAPGNFGLLARIVWTGLPLPLGGIHNARSFVSVWNLIDLIKTCIEHAGAANATLLVRDGEDISTSELLRKIAVAQGQAPRLFWVPRGVLKAGATLLGKRQMYDRLFDSLQVDDNATRKTLDWTPPLSLDEGIKRTFSTE